MAKFIRVLLTFERHPDLHHGRGQHSISSFPFSSSARVCTDYVKATVAGTLVVKVTEVVVVEMSMDTQVEEDMVEAEGEDTAAAREAIVCLT